jgi:drug/metabolite transporter (DMT)-like permease
MRSTTLRADILLLVAAMIWGSGFVAQRIASAHLDAFAFNGLRFTFGTLLLLPLLAFAPWPTHVARTSATRATWRGGFIAGIVMMLAANAQQHGLASTTASNGAFITSLYVVFVPFLAIAFHRQRIGSPVWFGVALAAIGASLRGALGGARRRRRHLLARCGADSIFVDSTWDDRHRESRHDVRARRRCTRCD